MRHLHHIALDEEDEYTLTRPSVADRRPGQPCHSLEVLADESMRYAMANSGIRVGDHVLVSVDQCSIRDYEMVLASWDGANLILLSAETF